MTGPWFIETLARNGDVLHRHRVDRLPIRIGRGYDNDYILDDAYAAPRHAMVELGEDGGLVLRDLGTRNGVVHGRTRRTSLPVDGNTVVRLGHTSLRIRAADFPVPAELLDRTMHGWEGALPGLAGTVLVALVALFTMWLADTQAYRPFRYLLALAYGMGAALVWSGLWAFGNRLFGRHARLGRHLFIFGCGIAALMLFRLLSSALGYAWSIEVFTRYGSHVAILLVAGMVYFHLTTVKPEPRRRFAVMCAALAVLGSGLVLISNEQRNGRLADELYMSVLLPPDMRATPDGSVDEFMADVAAMKAELDRERQDGDESGTDGREGAAN
ncbi:FHA domain-containing protein [Massilia sp. Dwa41.01b]|uniref:FHA domain-containing protein n=1 Tax=unclassified Massilia TaxID=2609279 RepID=UPI001603239A|nr:MULTISPECIES: FHA domain-containing protein [unclassified Massilia]QNA89681.1 FHA domain-containing protein [Massilia sp. Dwa41.01b]QNB00576.1 FHA domain-containing protein [Massilia sp. Se16.2.3]